jgi:RHS repeat-associated protein
VFAAIGTTFAPGCPSCCAGWTATTAASSSTTSFCATATRKTSSGTQLTQTTYGYDAHGRQNTITDARNGTTTLTFNADDQVVTTTTPAPGTGQAAQITTMAYNTSLQAWKVTQPDGTSLTNEFFLTGLLKKTYGSRTYPVEYTYDPQGRMKTMKTWQNFAGGTGTAITTWNYDAYRGWLNSKDYADPTTGAANTVGPDYTYTAAGRMATRLWARGSPRVTATYAYNNAGDLYTVTYNDGTTPGVTYTYDRRGRQKTVVCNGITTTLTFNDANQQLTESYTGGTLGGLTVSSGYDTLLRCTSLSLNTTPSALSYTYAYDTASRLSTVSDGAFSAAYTYLANSPLVSQITFKQSSTVRLTTSKQYDYLNRLQSIASAPSSTASLPLSYAYQYNDANQRVRMTLTDGSFWVYAYDALGQVVSGKRYWSDGTPVPGQQNEYTFDDIGNRSSAKFGGDASGANLRSASYTANRLNQYSSRTVPGGFDVVGIAPASTSVTVNGSAADYRRGEYFQEPISVSNGSVPVWQSVSVTTGGGGSASGNVWTPKTPENYGYDLDGNTTSDGRWTYTWDAENRLVRLVANTAVGPQQRIDLEYDWQGRRIRKKVWNNTGGTGTPAVDLKFVYDVWNVTAELDANASSNLKRSYVWGLDLSGSEQGAGGVGGLLLLKPASGNPLFVAYDGNGNVSGLIDATAGTTLAQYEYDPFGETLRMSGAGTVAKDNPLRFSTKYQDDESDLLYYGYRYYCPNTGRWLSRDPIGELAFQRNVVNRELSIENRLQAKKANVFENQEHLAYVFVGNDPSDKIDLLGLEPCNACGLAVDQALRLTRADVVSRFGKLGFWGQAKACAPIWLPVGGFSMAWDMNDMTWNWSRNMPCGKVTTCDQTVTVGGKCYNAWDVNYMLYGWAASLCGMGLGQMQDHVVAWKTLKGDFARLPGAMAFSTLGWFGAYSPLPPEIPPVGYPSCVRCPKTYPKHLGSVWP